MRILNALVATSIIALTSLPALATDLHLSWNAPTTYADGTPLPTGTVITYNLYGGTTCTTTPVIQKGITTTTSVRPAVDPGFHCYSVTAVVNGVESAQSNQASTTVAAPAPSAPGNLKVQ